MSNRFAIKNGLAQSDFDMNGFKRLNDATPGGGGGGGSTPMKLYDLKADFAAKGDGVQIVDGAITSATPTLTSASNPFASGDVGKIIVVAGAGASGADLVTTIATFNSAGSVALTASAGTTVTTAMVHFGSDDTTPLQNAVNTVSAASGGRIVAPAGIYMFGGALQTTGGIYNAQVKLPNVTPTNAPANVLMLQGDRPAPGDYFQPNFGKPPKYGTIFFSTVSGSGTRPCFMGGPQLSGGPPTPFSALNFYLRDITLRTVANPTISLLDLYRVGIAALEYVLFDVDRSPYDMVQPTTASSAAVYMPGTGNNARNVMRSVYIMGFYLGVRLGEHADIDDLTIQSCYHAVELETAYHASFIGRVLMQQCPYGIYVTGSCNVHITIADFEHGSWSDSGPAWLNPVYDLYDPSNNMKGMVWYHVEVASGSSTYAFLVNGAGNVSTMPIGVNTGGGNVSTLMIGTKARFVAIAGPPGGVRLQVQNNSAVWENVDSWLAST